MLKIKRTMIILGSLLSLVLLGSIACSTLAQMKAVRYMTEQTDPKVIAIEKEIIERFEKRYPDCKVIPEYVGFEDSFVKVLTMIKAGIPPDMYYLSAFTASSLYRMDALLPVGDVIDRFEDMDRSCVETYIIDGKVWGVPINAAGHYFWFRKDLYIEKGLTAPMYWDEVLKNAKKLTEDLDGDGSIDRWGIEILGNAEWCNQFCWLQFYWNTGGYLFDEENRIAFSTKYRKEALETFDYLKKLLQFAPPGFVGHGYLESRMSFIQGKVAQIQQSPRIPGDILRGNPDLEPKVGVVPPVIPEGGELHMWGGADGLAVLKNTKYPEVCKNFIAEYLSGDTYVEYLLTIPFMLLPTRISVYENPKFTESDTMIRRHPDWLKVMRETLPYIRDLAREHSGVINPKIGDMFDSCTLADRINKFYAGKISAEQVIDETAKRWQKLGGYEVAPAK